jgi:hypothetical protein
VTALKGSTEEMQFTFGAPNACRRETVHACGMDNC